MPNIGPMEIVIVLVLLLIVFGPKRLPELGRGMGRGMREFKAGVTGKPKRPVGEIAAPKAGPAAGAEASSVSVESHRHSAVRPD
jgi:sec-independent protein translocase protein TatA